MIDNTFGYWMLATFCCFEPIIFILVGIGIHRRYQRRGLGGILPRFGRRDE